MVDMLSYSVYILCTSYEPPVKYRTSILYVHFLSFKFTVAHCSLSILVYCFLLLPFTPLHLCSYIPVLHGLYNFLFGSTIRAVC
jgi:hypothetical protein